MLQKEEVKANFDKMAENYDNQWIKLATINNSLHLLMGRALANLPENANILCVGAGTGAEIIYLAQQFPQWTFTAVDPSAPMLDVCRRRLSELGIVNRCEFHAGYLETLPTSVLFDASTSILVSHFITDKEARSIYFGLIAKHLKHGGILVSADLSAELGSVQYQGLLKIWLEVMRYGGVTPDGLENIPRVFENDIALLPENEIAEIITSAGFEKPIHFYQAGLIHAWYSIKGQ